MKREWLLSKKFRWMGYVHTLAESRDEKKERERKKRAQKDKTGRSIGLGKWAKFKVNNTVLNTVLTSKV